MGEFDKTIAMIQRREANTNRIEEYILKFREIWLNELVEDVNNILPSGRKITREVRVETEEVNPIKRALNAKPRFTCKEINGQKYLTPIIPSTIGDIGDIRTLCGKLLRISEGRELVSEETTQWRKIIKIIDAYILKYDNGYEKDIRALISQSDPNRIMMFEDSKIHLPTIQKDEENRTGALNRLSKKTAINIKIKRGQIKEIEVGNESPSRNAHISSQFLIDHIKYNISQSPIQDRFFDDDNDEESELKFVGGKVYSELNEILNQVLSSFDTFEHKKAEGSIDTMIIELITPLYKYLKKIKPRSLCAAKMIIEIFNLSMDEVKIRNRIDGR